VFIDETWTATNMARTHGRCRKGERLRMGFPHGHRKTTTLVAGLRQSGMVAPMVLDGPINGDWFEAYVTSVLVPELKPGDIVVIPLGICLATACRAMGQPVQPQAGGDPREDRGGGRNAAVPSSLQPRLQPNRKGVLAPESDAPQGR
jgi:hypothetical protein